jgi:putative oxidoreductase
MDWVLLLGRVLFVFLFVQSGVTVHLRGREGAIAYAKQMGAPAPEFTVVLTGLQIVVSGVLIVLGIWVDLAALLLIAFLIPTNYWMHPFWKLEDPMQKMMQGVNFWKNTGLIGAALILFYLYQQFGDQTGLNIGPPSLFGG